MKNAFILTLIGSISFASYSNEKSALEPALINLPSGPGTIEGLGESFQPNLSTGMSTHSYSLALPSGRAGLTPSVTLSYNSGFGNDIAGLGRKFDFPYIQRRTNKGLPNYTDWPHGDRKDNDNDGIVDENDEFDTYITNNGVELIHIGNNQYRARYSENFARYEKKGDEWLVSWPDGLTYRLGNSVNSKVLTESGTFRWNVGEVRDTNNNVIVYRYQSLDSGSQRYLSEIEYNQLGSNSISMQFTYETRPDRLVSYVSGYKIDTAFRIKTAAVDVSGKPVKQYDFSYLPTSENQYQSILASVATRSGDRSESLPPVSFTYSKPEVQTESHYLPSMQNIPIYSPDVDMVDINSDGLPDVIDTSQSQHKYWLNSGENSNHEVDWLPMKKMAVHTRTRLSHPATKWADINGDGKSDLIQYNSRSTNYFTLDSNLNWQHNGQLKQARLQLDSPDVRLVDINNDKRIDALQLLTSGGRVTSHIVSLNLPDGWSNPIRLPLNRDLSSLSFRDNRVHLADMNGDGLQDLTFVAPGVMRYWPGRGLNGFGSKVEFSRVPRTIDRGEIKVQDMNQDGFADLVYLSGKQVQIWSNKGETTSSAALSLPITLQNPLGISPDLIRLADMNGNGSTDILWYKRGRRAMTYSYTDLYPNTPPSLLTSFTNGIGGRTDISYASVANEMVTDAKDNERWLHTVPIAMQVIKQTDRFDGVSNIPSTKIFDYGSGYYDAVEKQFVGFERASVRDLGDSSIPDLVTSYDFYSGETTRALKGHTRKVEAKAADGRVFWVDEYQRQVRDIAKGSVPSSEPVQFTVLISKKRTWEEKGSADPVSIGWEYDFDDYGNQTYLNEKGRLDEGWNDERVTRWRYSGNFSQNHSSYMVGLPVEEEVRDGKGNIIAKQQWLYDDESFSASRLGYVEKGNLTAVLDWYEPSDKTAFRYQIRQQFDGAGNVISKFAPLWGSEPGHAIYFEYDVRFNHYPVKETFDLGSHQLTVNASYNYDYGKLESFSDFNGHQTQFGYDKFGRLTRSVLPEDSHQNPSVAYTYQIAKNIGGKTLNWVETKTLQDDSGNKLSSRHYYDGSGRSLMQRQDAEHEVSVTKHHVYNRRGMLKTSYLPYFSSGLAYSALAPSSGADYEYDGLNRIVKTTQPHSVQDGGRTFSLVHYEPLAKWIEDEAQTSGITGYSGAKKHLVYDGLAPESELYGRIRQVSEHTLVDEFGRASGTQVWTSNYQFNSLGNFTQYTDAKGNVRTMHYDGLGRQTYINDPNRGESWHHYDLNGNLTGTRDARGWEVHYRYDGQDRKVAEYSQKTSEQLASGTKWAPSLKATAADTRYFYDNVISAGQQNVRGRLSQVIDLSGNTNWSYSPRGLIVETNRNIQVPNVLNQQYSTSKRYDKVGRVVQQTYPDGDQVKFHYNEGGLLEKVDGVLTNMDYTAAGLPKQRTLSNGVNTRYHYDSRHRLTGIESSLPSGGELQNLAYQLDPVSNITRIDDERSHSSLMALAKQLATTPATLNQDTSLEYDSWYRLTKSQFENHDLSYRYDPIGNLLGITDTNAFNTSELSVRYGDSVDLTNANTWNNIGHSTNRAGPNALTFTTSEISYDLSGNRLKDSKNQYQWDAYQRLVESISAEGSVTRYGYDSTNKRRFKVVTQADGTREHVIYIDDSSEIRNDQLVKFVAIGGQRIAESRQRSGTFKASRYYLHQHLGSVELALNEKAEAVAGYNYEPYGSLKQRFGPNQDSAYLFTGKERDKETGLGYFHHRYLDHRFAQFITPDPVFAMDARFTDPQQWSPYAYARGNPVMYVDPTGEYIGIAQVAAFAIGAAITGVAEYATNPSQGWANIGKKSLVGGAAAALSTIPGGGYVTAAVTGAITNTGAAVINNGVIDGQEVTPEMVGEAAIVGGVLGPAAKFATQQTAKQVGVYGDVTTTMAQHNMTESLSPRMLAGSKALSDTMSPTANSMAETAIGTTGGAVWSGGKAAYNEYSKGQGNDGNDNSSPSSGGFDFGAQCTF
ncbi:FG-GAP-like repeat-containing protein [Vibrio sp. Of7-15]|uniref:toxin TcdB middle/N-terminal domain-containing protein n=1 Tax=Vibrio sp. Of7-15 TaxID=2724879 RepID=UPI001EF1926E|nr:toxin TcdB middle/N-terminal domain-containing protein [Vibrio sp. Of7-15]MCG7495412.1 FG-GAP-like repeat-containing protein [Vibrio sp. Of7-15]